MKVYMIWAVEPDNVLDDPPFLVDTWDEYSVGANEEGWHEAVEKAFTDYGGANVRVMTASFPFSAVRKLWEVPNVAAKAGKEETA